MGVAKAKLRNNIMKSTFLEWPFDFMRISQNRNHVFLLRSTFFISNFEQKSSTKKFMHIFERDFLWRNASGTVSSRPENSQKRTYQDQDGIRIKILLTKVDRSKKTCFVMWGILKVQKQSRKNNFFHAYFSKGFSL